MKTLVVVAAVVLAGMPVRAVAVTYQSTNRTDKVSSVKLHREGKKAIRKGQYDKALQIFEELIKLDSNDFAAHLGRSLAALKQGNFKLCYDHANSVLERQPSNARAHALAGAALLRSGYVANGAAEVVRAHEIDPKEALAYGIAAEIDYCEGRPSDARLKAFKANSLDPNEPDYLVTIARAASRLELFSEAAEAYESFLRISPETDKERRDRIRGLISFYRRLGDIKVYELSGPRANEARFRLGSDRRPYLSLKINGRDATFVVDTGSSFTVISSDAAKRFGVREIARGGNSQGFGGSGKFPIVFGLIKTLEIGDLRIKSVPCFLRAFHSTGDVPEDGIPDGFIGLSVLAHFITELDYAASVIRFDRSNEGPSSAGDTAVTIPFRTTQNGLISVESELSGKRINAILDSAASSSVVSAAAVDRFNLYDNLIKGQTATVIGAAGVADGVSWLSVPSYSVAGLRRDNIRALVLDFSIINEDSGFEQNGILGGDFLRHFKVRIDFSRAVVALQPQGAGS